MSDEKLAKKIQKEPELLAELQKTIQTALTTDVQTLIKDLSRFVHHRMLEFSLGRSMTDNEFNTPNSKQILSKRQLAQTAPVDMKDDIPLSLETIMEELEHPIQNATLALILQESLNDRLSRSYAEHSLNRVLLAKDVATGRDVASSHHDQMDPIRPLTVAASICQRKLPPALLTTGPGLSNLLTWQGTRQSSRTVE